jgi:hypothetical protein
LLQLFESGAISYRPDDSVWSESALGAALRFERASSASIENIGVLQRFISSATPSILWNGGRGQ